MSALQMESDEATKRLQKAVDTALPGMRRLAERLARWERDLEMWTAPQFAKTRVRELSRLLLRAAGRRPVTVPPGSAARYEAMRRKYPAAPLKQDAAFNQRQTPAGTWVWTRWADAVDEARDGVLLFITPKNTYWVRYTE